MVGRSLEKREKREKGEEEGEKREKAQNMPGEKKRRLDNLEK